jgi:hypothetical protein
VQTRSFMAMVKLDASTWCFSGGRNPPTFTGIEHHVMRRLPPFEELFHSRCLQPPKAALAYHPKAGIGRLSEGQTTLTKNPAQWHGRGFVGGCAT